MAGETMSVNEVNQVEPAGALHVLIYPAPDVPATWTISCKETGTTSLGRSPTHALRMLAEAEELLQQHAPKACGTGPNGAPAMGGAWDDEGDDGG